MVRVPRQPSARDPWPGQNREVPSRVGGLRVLAAIKLVPAPNTRVHRWVIIDEAASGLFGLRQVAYDRDGRVVVESPGFTVSSYTEALGSMIQLAAAAGTLAQYQGSAT